jgi:protein-S-isoprenylcysteine O-methyltransferase Ste14
MKVSREHLPAILNGLSGIAVLLVSFLLDLRMPLPREVARPLGFLIVAVGMAVVAWAAVYLRSAFVGEVEPKLNVLVRNGPYRLVRHPVYVGMTTALLGAAVTLRSGLGMIGTLLLFLPTEIYRARQEDEALARRFGGEWRDYASQTGFMLPFIGKG